MAGLTQMYVPFSGITGEIVAQLVYGAQPVLVLRKSVEQGLTIAAYSKLMAYLVQVLKISSMYW